MKINLKDFDKAALQSLSVAELDPDKRYLVMVNAKSAGSLDDGFLETLTKISSAFQAVGIKSIILVNRFDGDIPCFEIGVEKEVGEDEPAA